LVAGASVSSVQQVVNGLITQDEISIRATGSINSLELVDEVYQGNMVTVTIRADIFPQEKQCFSADYRKTLLITKSHLKAREQANIGGIYTLDKAVMKRLSNKLSAQGLYLDTKLAFKHNSAFSRYKHSMQEEKIKQLTMSLADISDSQYVLFSEINDISFAHDENNSWQFWQRDIFNRHFNLTVYIYNGSNGELVFSEEYQNSAPWDYNKRAQVDVKSATFWHGEYGEMVDQTLTQMITDIDENMMCQPTRGKIVNVAGSEIIINLGSQQGVQVGDEFSLLHKDNFISNNGNTYAGFNVSDFKVKVTKVTGASATATTPDLRLIDSIQVSDLAVRY